MRADEAEWVKRKVERIIQNILRTVRLARETLERGETEDALERLLKLEDELIGSEFEFEWDRSGRGPRLHDTEAS